MITSDDIKKGMVGLIMLSLFVLAFLVLKPIMISVIFGLLASYIFSPVYKKIYAKTKRKNLSALLIIFGLVLIFAIPIIYFVPMIVNQTFQTYVSFQNLDVAEILGDFVNSEATISFAKNIDNLVGQFFSSFLNQFTDMLVNLPSLLLQFAVFLFTFFFVVRDSDVFREYITALSPFSKKMEKKIMDEFRGITNAIVFGQVAIGIIQGLALGAGMFFLDVPNVMVLTFAACIVSIIPLIGAWTIWLPVSAFLLINGNIFSGVILLLYGALFVSTIDNILRPYILSKQSSLPVAISVIGTIGGLYFFGIAGILLGPLILAYVLIIIEFYQQGKLKELFDN